MPIFEDKSFKDYVNSLPAATENDLSAGNNMPVVSASEVKKMGGNNVASRSIVDHKLKLDEISLENFSTGFILLGDYSSGTIAAKVSDNYTYRGNYKYQANYNDGTNEVFNCGGLWGPTSAKINEIKLAKPCKLYVFSDYCSTPGNFDVSIAYTDNVERRLAVVNSSLDSLTTAFENEKNRSQEEDFYGYVEDEVLTPISSVANYKVYYNLQYGLAALRATSGITSYAFAVEKGKKYRIKRCYGVGGYETPFAVLCAGEIASASSASSFYEEYGNNPSETYAELDDVDITPSRDGVLYVMALSSWGGTNVVSLTPKSVKDIVRYHNSVITKNNQWLGKKICVLGTSVGYGSNATKAYAKIAGERLGCTIVPAVVPGLAIHIDSVVSGTPKPLTYGSTTMSKEEYIAAKNAGLTNIVISQSAIPNSEQWNPGSAGGYNNYWRTWENVFAEENADVDLWIFSTVPNNTNFSNTDWDAFNKNEWRYNDNSSFESHRTTFLGAMLYLMDKMYSLNPKAKMALCLDSEFRYWDGGKEAMNKLKTQWAIPVIDLYGKITKTPQMYSAFRSSDAHPSTFGQEQLGNIFTNELLLLP